MKKNNKELLDDLLEDDAPPDFQAALMEKTLQSVRRRKRARHFSVAACALAIVGVLMFSFVNMRERVALPEPAPHPEAMAANTELPRTIEVVRTRLASVKEFATADALSEKAPAIGLVKNATGPAPKRRFTQPVVFLRHVQCTTPRVHYRPKKRGQMTRRAEVSTDLLTARED